MKVKKVNKNIHLVTLGCSKNLVDSENLMLQLEAGGFKVFHDSENPSGTVIINTCGFINDAKEESVNTILEFARARKQGKIEKLLVMGCLSQRYKKELEAEIHEVDGFFGVADMENILLSVGTDLKKDLIGERVLTTPSHYAYLKISEGCDRTCSFCAIPLIRGKHVSRTMESLVAEAGFLARKGVKELILIAQDLSWYGLDIYKKRMLATLLSALEKVDGIEWIRLHYAYPAGFPEDVLEIMAGSSKICKYLDIPVQHISDSILSSMRRGHNSSQTRELLQRIRLKVPGIALRTSLIVGYPGETKKDFEELKTFVKEIQFERLGVFSYSHEENTHAFNLKDSVSSTVKKARVEELMAIQEEISLELNQKKTGNTFKTIIDRKEGDFWVGRSCHDSPEIDNEILIPLNFNLKPGNFYNIEITSAEAFDLFGEPIAD